MSEAEKLLSPDGIEERAEYYSKWAADIRAMNGVSVDADHSEHTAFVLRALLANTSAQADHIASLEAQLAEARAGLVVETAWRGEAQLEAEGARRQCGDLGAGVLDALGVEWEYVMPSDRSIIAMVATARAEAKREAYEEAAKVADGYAEREKYDPRIIATAWAIASAIRALATTTQGDEEAT